MSLGEGVVFNTKGFVSLLDDSRCSSNSLDKQRGEDLIISTESRGRCRRRFVCWLVVRLNATQY